MEFTIAFIGLFFWSIYLTASLLIFLSGVVIILGQIVCHIEGWNKFDGLYWSFVTATTVGYGDIRPVKKISKILSILIAFVGMIFTGVIIAIAINSSSVALDQHADQEIIEQMKERFYPGT